LLRRDGSPFWVAVTRSLARTRSGSPRYIIELMFDIDRYKRTEEARERALAGERAARIRVELAEARIERLQAITSELSGALTPTQVADIVLTQGRAALYADAGYVALQGEDGMVDVLLAPGYPEELIEPLHRFPITAHLPSADCIRTGQLLVFESREAYRTAYPDIPTQDWARTWVTVPMTVGKRIVGALGITYLERCQITREDREYMMTLAHHCAQALERARLYEAEQRARLAREEALAIAAHDLRNPLTAISLGAASLSRMAPEGEAGQQIREKARKLKASTEYATRMLHDLLDAAIIEAKTLTLETAPHEVDTIIAEVAEIHEPLADQKELRLHVRPLGYSLRISCDRARLAQALSNLIGNALKFTAKGGGVTLAVALDGASVRFSVRDTGAGIKPENLPRLFDRYWRPRAVRGAGAGLGLYIVKGIVEGHGGQLSVDSHLGVGTEFSFTIPIERSHEHT